jgi:hypothetical protein
MALSGLPTGADLCPVSGEERTSRFHNVMSGFDPILHRNKRMLKRPALRVRELVPKVRTVDCGYSEQNNSLS